MAVSTPRRWGKTWALAMLIGALLRNVPGITIAVFAPSLRAGSAADGMLGFARASPSAADASRHVKRMLDEVWGVTAFKAANEQHLSIKVARDVRQVKAFPAGKNA